MSKILLIFLLSLGSAEAASFDCTKASSIFEKTICNNDELSKLDEALADNYKKAISSSPTPQQLKNEQLNWIKYSRECGDNTNCISQSYKKRLDDLKSNRQIFNDNNELQTNIPQQTAGDLNKDINGKILKTVVAEGTGIDIESASKNAAENALMQVVGTFVDAQKQIDKRTEIANGLRNETKNLTSSIKEYSQGTIKSFNVIDAKQDGVLTRVNAQVVVRIDDFHAYIKKLAEGEVAVNEGLFVKMATDKKQSEDLSSIMASVIKPIENGEVIDFVVSDPKPLEDLQGNYCSADCLSQIKKKVGGGNVVQFEVKALLNDGFKKNIINTLESISSEKKQYYFDQGTFFASNYQPLHRIQDMNDVSILVNHDGEKLSMYSGVAPSAMIFDTYRIKEINDKFSKKINIDTNTPYSVKPSTTLNIDVIDSDNSVLQHDSIGGITKNKALVLPTTIDQYSFNSIMLTNQDQSWSNEFRLYERITKNGLNCFIYAVKKFIVVMSINDDALPKAKKIKLYLKPI